MMLIDTSIVIDVLRGDRDNVERLFALIGPEQMAFARFTELEVMMGTRDKRDWDRTAAMFDRRTIIDPKPDAWRRSARVYFDLRRNGKTIRSIADICIAMTAVDNNLELIHNDRDFVVLAEAMPLKQTQLRLRSQ
jgi:predicted nucleic acid-binding protein